MAGSMMVIIIKEIAMTLLALLFVASVVCIVGGFALLCAAGIFLQLVGAVL